MTDDDRIARSSRRASCQCGQLAVDCAGDPFRISVCHCLNCKQRSGSAFAAQARFAVGDVTITGASGKWTRISDEGNAAHFHFCPQCGSNVYYFIDQMPDVIAVPIGGFAEPGFPPPEYSVYEGRKHAWVEIVGEGIDHYD